MFAVSSQNWTIILTACLIGVNASASAARAGDWLDGDEREFFLKFGARGRVAGKDISRTENLKALSKAAKQSTGPNQETMVRAADAYTRGQMTDDEKKALASLMQRGQHKLQAGMQVGLLRTLLGDDSFDVAADAVNTISGEAVDAWRIQRVYLERNAKAMAEFERAIAALTANLESRIDKRLTPEQVGMELGAEGDRLTIRRRNGATSLHEPLIQVAIHKRQTKGDWTVMNGLVGALSTQWLDIDPVEGTRLAAAQERGANRPFHCVALLPDLAAGASASIPLVPLRMCAAVERVELRVWCEEGSVAIDELKGLPRVVAEYRAELEKQQKRLAHARSGGSLKSGSNRGSRSAANAKGGLLPGSTKSQKNRGAGGGNASNRASASSRQGKSEKSQRDDNDDTRKPAEDIEPRKPLDADAKARQIAINQLTLAIARRQQLDPKAEKVVEDALRLAQPYRDDPQVAKYIAKIEKFLGRPAYPDSDSQDEDR